MNRIYKMTEKAIEMKMDWDQAINENEIETVKKFETLKETLEEYRKYDSDFYGAE